MTRDIHSVTKDLRSLRSETALFLESFRRSLVRLMLIEDKKPCCQ